MSRELKFRVWDGERMHNVTGQGLHLTFWNHPTRIAWGLYDFSDTKITDSQYGIATIMQFTGLKDKNGKEIYEGDVVEAKSWQPMNYAVEFIEGGFCFTHPKLKGSPIDINLMYSSNGCACSVIGNIYENPELLKP